MELENSQNNGNVLLNQKREREIKTNSNGETKKSDISKTKTLTNGSNGSLPDGGVIQVFYLLNLKSTECPYLSTINRHLLDFDFEKICSVSLTNLNTYACLICGKYYQGKGRNTYAYTHALEASHHLFINLTNQKIYCLPDNYEVINHSLEDIKNNIKPQYSSTEIEKLDTESTYRRSLDGTEFIPGTIGLNNIKKTDYANVIFQALAHMSTLRNFFLGFDYNIEHVKNFFKCFRNMILRQIWSIDSVILLKRFGIKKTLKDMLVRMK